jgi:hypothetical protein
VSLILELLTKPTDASEHAFDKVLMSLSQGLDDIYDEILTEIDRSSRVEESVWCLNWGSKAA